MQIQGDKVFALLSQASAGPLIRVVARRLVSRYRPGTRTVESLRLDCANIVLQGEGIPALSTALISASEIPWAR